MSGNGGAVALLLVAAVVTLSACAPREGAPAPHEPGQGAAPAGATLALGLVPEQNIFRQRARYAPIVSYLGRHAEVRVELFQVPSYGAVLDEIAEGRLDGAFLGSFAYALAHRRLGVVPLARPLGIDGHATYHGLLLVRRDAGIDDIRQLRGRRLALVDRATTAGYLLPMVAFARAGVRDPRSFLGEMYFAGTHEDAIRDVLTGKADAAAAKSTIFERMVREAPPLAHTLVTLARSPEVPENALAVRAALDPALRQRLRAVLLAMGDDEEGRLLLEQFGAARFVPAEDADYEPVYRLAGEAGIDLATYHGDAP